MPITPVVIQDDTPLQCAMVQSVAGCDEFSQNFDAFRTLAPTIRPRNELMNFWTGSWEEADLTWQPNMSDSFFDERFNQNSPNNAMASQHSTDGHLSLAENTTLPDFHDLNGHVDVYFRRVHHFLPILHRPTFQSALYQSYAEPSSHALIFAVLSLATCERQGAANIASRVQWYNKAKELYTATDHVPTHPLPTLQAAVCLIFQGMMVTDFHAAWLTLGKAWRQVVALGYHCLDSTRGKTMSGAPQAPQDPVTRECIRRVVWTLYILDRGLCFPVGLVHNIEDKYLDINLPMDEDAFQISSYHDETSSVRYTSSFNKLLGMIRETAIRTKRENQLHYIILAYVLLGKIVSHFHYSDELDHMEKDSVFRRLEDSLTNLRLCLPRSVTSLSAVPFDDLRSVAWLNVVMNINTVFLYHGKIAESDGIGFQHWHSCLNATRNTVAMIREAGAISVDLLLNPHTASPLFCSARILIIEYLVPTSPITRATAADGGLDTPESDHGDNMDTRTTAGDALLKRDLDLVMLVYERLEEAFGPIGTKFKKGIQYYLRQDVDTAASLKKNGIADIMSRCASWGALPPGIRAADTS